MNEDSRAILTKHHINITKTRIALLESFLQSSEPLTLKDFYSDSMPELNRISIFRTLKLFLHKKIIYRVHTTERTSRYLLRRSTTSVHSNFICRICKKVMPVNTIDLPEVELPEDFTQQNIEIIIEGLCDACKSKQ
jgi:Fur family transcriptional regulator, ferric uptake regulator